MLMLLAGALLACLASVVAMTIVDGEFRTAIAQVALAFALGPAALIIVWARSGPRMQKISPKALEGFCRQVGPGMAPAWLLSYRGRGILFVRRREDSGWRNNVPNRATDAERHAR